MSSVVTWRNYDYLTQSIIQHGSVAPLIVDHGFTEHPSERFVHEQEPDYTGPCIVTRYEGFVVTLVGTFDPTAPVRLLSSMVLKKARTIQYVPGGQTQIERTYERRPRYNDRQANHRHRSDFSHQR